MSAGKGDKNRTADLNAYRSSPLWDNLFKKNNSYSEFSDRLNTFEEYHSFQSSNNKYLLLDEIREIEDCHIRDKKLAYNKNMKAYKATYNLKCREHQFNIGETYSTDTLQICESGFHFCKEMSDTLTYYDFKNDFILLEVEILGDTQFEGNKGVTNKLKVLRIVPEEEWSFMTRNEKGDRCVQYKDSDGRECWKEYDENGNRTYYKSSYGYEWWREYDMNGNETYSKDSDGDEFWREYDVNGRMTYYKSSYGYEWWAEYDVNGNNTYYKTSTGYEWWTEYDVNGNETHFKDSSGYESGKSVKN